MSPSSVCGAQSSFDGHQVPACRDALPSRPVRGLWGVTADVSMQDQALCRHSLALSGPPPQPQFLHLTVGSPGPAPGLCWELWQPRVLDAPSRAWNALEPEGQQLRALVLGIMPWWESRNLPWRTRGLQTPPPLEGADTCGAHLGHLFLAQTRDGVIHSFRMIVNYGREEVPALGFEPFPLLFLFFLLMSVMGSAETWERKALPF